MSELRVTVRSQNGFAGRTVGSLFFLVFLGMGLFFGVLILREFMRAASTYRWPRISCVLLESAVTQDGLGENPYRFRVRYEYEWQGRTYTSRRWSQADAAFSAYADAQRLADRHRADTRGVCYVNPAEPTEAVLQRSSLWIGLLIVLPLIFVGIGGLGMVAVWRSTTANPEVALARPISTRGRANAGKRLGWAVLLLFLVLGAFGTYALLGKPLAQVLAARTWTPVPCTVLSSRILSHVGRRTAYSVDILYSYRFNGREYRSNRYNFTGGSSSRLRRKTALVDHFPPGRVAMCYVDPADPSSAVLQRGLTPDMLLGLLPAVFLLVGAGGLLGLLRKAQAAAETRAGPVPLREIIGLSVSPTPSADSGVISGPRVLKSSESRVVGLVVVAVFAAIWNTLIYIGMARAAWEGRGVISWLTTLFMIPFVLVGLGMIGASIYLFLKLFNPRAEVTIDPGEPALGEVLRLSWQLSGRTASLRGLKVWVEAREEATSRQGTRKQIDRKTFLKLEAAQLQPPLDLKAGCAQVVLPRDSVPSFRSENNQIRWSIQVRGVIPRWPDLQDEFEVRVRPQPLAREAAA